MDKLDAHTQSIALAYGLLWHVVTPDPRVNRARDQLRERLSRRQREIGIRMATDAGCLITMRETAVIDATIDAQPAPGLHAPLRILKLAGARRNPPPTPLGLSRA